MAGGGQAGEEQLLGDGAVTGEGGEGGGGGGGEVEEVEEEEREEEHG